MEIKAHVDYKKLKNAIKAMSEEWNVKVGLLSGKGGEEQISEDLDLAGLGAIHEFGATINVTDKMRAFFRHQFKINLKKTTTTIVIPARSFLELPIATQTKKLRKYLLESFDDLETVEYWIAEKGDLMTVAVMLGAAGVRLVNEAFETSGWGNWAPNSPLTIAQKGSAMPLVDTGKLRQSITYEVQKNV